MAETVRKNLGMVTAYAYAVSKGYTGTEEEFAELMASYADVAQDAEASAQAAAQSATTAEQKATQAAGSATNAAVSATSASESAQAAAGSSNSASLYAQNASTSATNAAGSASSASAYAENASASAQGAKGSANAAQASATQAAGSADDAEAAKDLVLGMNAVANTLPAGSQATASYSNGTLTLGIPQGEKGELGESAYDQALEGGYTGLEADFIEDLNSISLLNDAVHGEYSKNYTEGKNLSTTEIIDDPDTCISDYVSVTWGTSRVRFEYTNDTADAHTYRIWFLDENKNLIQYYGRNPAGANFRFVNAPENAAFVLFSFKKGFAGGLYSSNTDVYYTAQELIVTPGLEQNVGDLSGLETSSKDSLVDAINEVRRSNVSLPIKPKDTNFFYVSPNNADPEEFVENEYVNQTNGQFTSNTSHKRSGYIPVEAGATYCIVNENAADSEIRYAFYTSEKVYISGAIVRLATVDYVVTAPDNAAYIVISAPKSVWPLMVAKSDELIPYEEFGITYLQPEYLPSSDLISDVIVNLPSKIYAYVGYELNIYFENIVEDWTKYKWDVNCSKGRQIERGYNITPVGDDVGTYTLTIKLYTSDDNAKTVSTSLVISPLSAGADATKSLIILGDSTTANGIAVGKLVDNFASDDMIIDLRGTRGEAPAKHEGRSGWSWDTYFTTDTITYTDGRGTVDNPFYNPTSQTFDASYYFAHSGVSAPDWFFLNMGINDMFSFANDAALESGIVTAMGLLESAITSIKTAAPATKIGLCLTIPPNHSQDAFGKAYKCNQTRDRYKRNNLLWVNRLISEYDNREGENIYLVPIYTNLDTVYNMGMEALPVNARNTETTYQSPISNGGVHPVASGYWQIADVYTAFLKAHVE